MPKYPPISNNRLLALEQELLEKKRLAEILQGKRDVTFAQKIKTKITTEKQHTNNRLLELEQELLKSKKIRGVQKYKENNLSAENSVSYPTGDRIIYHSNNRLLALEQELLARQPKPQKQKPKSKRGRVQSQVFDNGEPIQLRYNSKIYPYNTPQTTANYEPEKLSEIETIEVESSDLELPVTAEGVVSNSEIVEGISQERETLLSETAELISDINPKLYPLQQQEDISMILAELDTVPKEIPPTAISPSTESKGDRPNPHAIFDRMGKNMAYATAFDLGTIELEQLFDEFDTTLDQQEQLNQDDSVSKIQNDLVLEQRFNEFDTTLDKQEQLNQDDSVSQKHSDRNSESEKLELEQRFDEFDRILELEAQDIKSSEDSEVEEYTEPNLMSTVAHSVTPVTDISIASSRIPATSLTPKNSPLSDPQLNPDNGSEFEFKFQAFLFRTGLNLISLINGLVNLLFNTQVRWKPEIDELQSTPSFQPYNPQGKTTKKIQVFQLLIFLPMILTIQFHLLFYRNQKSDFMLASKLRDFPISSRDPLTGMSNNEFTRSDSDFLSEGVQEFEEHLNSTTATSQFSQQNSHRKQSERKYPHSSKERKNNTS